MVAGQGGDSRKKRGAEQNGGVSAGDKRPIFVMNQGGGHKQGRAAGHHPKEGGAGDFR